MAATVFGVRRPGDAVNLEVDILAKYVEKQLGKMHPTPLPMWDDYLWPTQPEPDAPQQTVQRSSVHDLADRLAADGTLSFAPAPDYNGPVPVLSYTPNDGTTDGSPATVTLTDGTQIMARDYVVVSRLPRPSGLNPPDGAEQIPTPEKLTWSPVDQAGWYQVFIRDIWNDGKLIYTSKLQREPVLVLPPGLLQADGLYTWKVHARDINEDKQLGDFNKGSMSRAMTFSTASD